MTFTIWHIIGACVIVAIIVAVIATIRTRQKDIKKEGSGIGLSLARQIMRQHNGTIDLVRSDVNQTVFQLIFR